MLTNQHNNVCFTLINHYSGFPRTISNCWDYPMWMRTFVPDYLEDVLITDKAINEVYGDINTEITVYGGFEVTPAMRVSLMRVS